MYRGVAQLVAFLVWDQAVAGSSPVTPTSKKEASKDVSFFRLNDKTTKQQIAYET